MAASTAARYLDGCSARSPKHRTSSAQYAPAHLSPPSGASEEARAAGAVMLEDGGSGHGWWADPLEVALHGVPPAPLPPEPYQAPPHSMHQSPPHAMHQPPPPPPPPVQAPAADAPARATASEGAGSGKWWWPFGSSEASLSRPGTPKHGSTEAAYAEGVYAEGAYSEAPTSSGSPAGQALPPHSSMFRAAHPQPSWWPSTPPTRRPRSTSAPPARPTMPLPFCHEPTSRYAQGERERLAAREAADRDSHARLVQAEARAAAAMEELAKVHAELNLMGGLPVT